MSLPKRRKRWPPIYLIPFLLFTLSTALSNFDDEQTVEDETVAPEPMRSPIDCDFDLKLDNDGMCSWRTEQTPDGQPSIWHTGNSVLVDSANSIVKSAMGDDRFAFVQGHFGAASEAVLLSQTLRNAPGITNQLQFSYWKSAFGPILDVCLKKLMDSSLQCIDSIVGAGGQQWTQRTLALPQLDEPFQVLFRARNIHSAEDLIGLDDIKLRIADDNLEPMEKSPLLNSASTSKIDQDPASANPLDRKQPIQFNNFEMRRSQTKGAIIQPAVQRSQPPIALDEQRLPIQDNDNPISPISLIKPANSVVVPKTRIDSLKTTGLSTSTTTASPPPNIPVHHHSPIPNVKNSDFNFPDFPSFDSGHLGAPINLVPMGRVEDTDSCKAVKCSFLDTSCLWTLGKSWKLGQGNIAIEATNEDSIRSGYFKAQLATFLEFDLWMSDDANLFVVQETQEIGMPGTDELSLFSRRGMASNGWHRFRVPLRPSFNAIRLKIRASLPNQNAFVTLSNTRLVNANGEEASCEATSGVFLPPLSNQWQNGVPLMNGALQMGELTTMSDPFSTTITPFVASISPLAAGTPPLNGNPFALPTPTSSTLELMKNLDANVLAFQQQQQPSLSMIMDGVTPIVPMRDSLTQRLTAFQKLPQRLGLLNLPTLPSLFDSTSSLSTASPQMFLPFLNSQTPVISRPLSTTQDPPPIDPFNDHDLISASEATTRESLSLKEVNDRSETGSFTEVANSFLRDNKINLKPDKSTDRDITRLVNDIAGQPNAEQKLKQLAQQFGVDFYKLANGKQLAALRQVFNNHQPIDLPSTIGQIISKSDTSGLKPIRPTGVSDDDFERALQRESQKHLSGHTISGEMLKKLAKVLNLAPNNPIDHDSPMVRDNLDFVFQNAMIND